MDPYQNKRKYKEMIEFKKKILKRQIKLISKKYMNNSIVNSRYA